MVTMLTALLGLAMAKDGAEIDGDFLRLQEGEHAPAEWSTVAFEVDRHGTRVAGVLDQAVSNLGTYAVSYRDLCHSQCRIGVRPGYRRFLFYGAGATPGAVELDLRPGETHLVEVDAGSHTLRWLGIGTLSLGITGLVVGPLVMSDPGKEGNAVGAGLLAGGAVLSALTFPLFNLGKTKVSVRAGGD